jgi:hypothetical protein
MKYFLALTFLLIAGCSSPTTPAPYAPGGEYYVAPGVFVGIWDTVTEIYNKVTMTDSNLCNAVIARADSLFAGTITNTVTHQELILSGFRELYSVSGPNPRHFYWVFSLDTVGDTALGGLGFTDDGDSLTYNGWSVPSNLSINCVRK